MDWRPSSDLHDGAGEVLKQHTGPCLPSPGSAGATYTHDCRCGGQFWLAEDELREDAESVLVPCCTCSAVIHVLYGLAPS